MPQNNFTDDRPLVEKQAKHIFLRELNLVSCMYAFSEVVGPKRAEVFHLFNILLELS